MAFPIGWPPRTPTGIRSIRVYATGTATGNFSDNAILFSQIVGANTFVPLPYVPPGGTIATVQGRARNTRGWRWLSDGWRPELA